MAHVVTCEDLLTRVQGLAPVMRAHADQGERERHLMAPRIEALKGAGHYHLVCQKSDGHAQP
jgi:hypothetical protein